MTVRVVESIRNYRGDTVDNCMGLYTPALRDIQIEAENHPRQERQTLEHEWSHSVLYDTGLNNILTKDQTEAVCDAVALGLVVRFHS